MSVDPQRRSILAPTDFSELSIRAVNVADRVAIERDADLTLLHVHPIVQSAFLDMTYTEPPQKLGESINFLEDKMMALADALLTPNERIHQSVMLGSPVDIITQESSNHGLLVISTHGRTGISQMLMGSVAEKVVRLAHCSLLVIK
ncbi:MAG: universal stress protein [Myxococcota bacterium]|nr:universal stress protein [Myxococcota bacterium]